MNYPHIKQDTRTQQMQTQDKVCSSTICIVVCFISGPAAVPYYVLLKIALSLYFKEVCKLHSRFDIRDISPLYF